MSVWASTMVGVGAGVGGVGCEKEMAIWSPVSVDWNVGVIYLVNLTIVLRVFRLELGHMS